MSKPIYYPETTEEERMQLFNVWELTGSVTEACAKTKLSRATFYYWKDAFVTGGYRALAQEPMKAEHQRTAIPQVLTEEIIALRQQHPHWGKWQILHALRSAHPFDRYATIDTVNLVLDEMSL